LKQPAEAAGGPHNSRRLDAASAPQHAHGPTGRGWSST